jgi:peptide/nickel transport system permease protein|tara:strand:- start:77 stop:1000 length:924 start_codon:yes stop_codon:yes gene_type:complete
MTRFVIHRLLALIPLLIGVSFIVFMMLQLVPGDPVMMMLGEFSMATTKDVEAMREQLGFNDPLYIQYWNYFKGLITGDLGTSMRTKKPVIDLILARLPSTFELTFFGLLFAIIFGTSLGIIAALKHNTFIDYFTVVIALLGVSIPGFWLALLFIFFFSIRLEWLPITGSSPLTLIMPCLALGLWAGGTIARLVRSGMLEVLQSDYVRTARAKGLYKHRIILVHALRNALLPVVTIFGIQFGHVLAGTVIIEAVFARPGLGLMMVNAIVAKDFPLVQGTIMFVAGAYIVVNILVEVLYTYLDPRIRYS